MLYLDAEDVDASTRRAAREAIEELAEATSDDPTATAEKEVAAAGRLRKLAPKLWENGEAVFRAVLSEAAKKGLGLS